MDIRKATPGDAPAILAVTHKAFTLYHDELHADYVVGGLVETNSTAKSSARSAFKS